jgi:polyisoprenoid-binding protein YceI
VGFSLTGELAREDYGLTWNQALEPGGVLVGKKVKRS